LIKIICSAKGLESDAGENPFSDVSAADWFEPYIKTAYKNKITDGYDDGTFRPQQNITRQDICTMIYRAFFDTGEYEFNGDEFADINNISDYAKNAVGCLYSHNIVNGRDDNLFCPWENATRAEIAKIIYLCLEIGGD
jgi:hypothetical protein